MNLDAGTYTIQLIALDEAGNEVSGTEETVTIQYG